MEVWMRGMPTELATRQKLDLTKVREDELPLGKWEPIYTHDSVRILCRVIQVAPNELRENYNLQIAQELWDKINAKKP